MEVFRHFARPTSYFVLLCLLGLGSYIPASRAAIVGTEAVASEHSIQIDRDQLNQLFQRDDVKSYLLAQGVDPASVQARVNGLSDAEIQALAEQLDEYPAGEGTFETILILAFLAFIALLITDILGLTDIFPFVNSSSK
jgi:hypothetical protein